jgi:hypothetical protein
VAPDQPTARKARIQLVKMILAQGEINSRMLAAFEKAARQQQITFDDLTGIREKTNEIINLLTEFIVDIEAGGL